MEVMTNRKRACLGAVLAALVILAIPVAAGASDVPKVRMTQLVAGRVVLEVADATVAVRKEVFGDRSIVTMTSPHDQLSITIRRGGLSVSRLGDTVPVDITARADAERLMVMLQESEAAANARKLLQKVVDGPGTFVGQSILLTRAVLELGSGGADALRQQQRWVAGRAASLAAKPLVGAGRPALIRTALVEPLQKTPGECWEMYSMEAIRIANDFADCTDGLKWYDALGWSGCSLIYAVRSEAAMAWFISCNGGIPFQG